MKIGILGGGNPYALNLATLCKKEGIDVFGIGRSPERVPALWIPNYRYYQLHIGNHLEAVLGTLGTERPDYLISYAAQGEGQASFANPVPFYKTNVFYLVRLVEELRKVKYLKRFIQIGTSELYGSVEAPSKETDQTYPSSPYAVSKLAFDLHLGIIRKEFENTVIRPSNCYCVGQQLHRIIPKAIIYALSGKKLPLQGGGRARKSYLHASDLSRAILLSLTSEPGIYNVGPDVPNTIWDIVSMCADQAEITYYELVEIVQDRVGQDGQYWLDSSKIKALGWKQEISLVNGIQEMVDWIKSYPEILQMSTEWSVRP